MKSVLLSVYDNVGIMTYDFVFVSINPYDTGIPHFRHEEKLLHNGFFLSLSVASVSVSQ